MAEVQKKKDIRCVKCGETAPPNSTVSQLAEDGWAVEYNYQKLYSIQVRIAKWLCPHCANAY